MKYKLLALACAVASGTVNAQLMITGVIDGPLTGGVPKAIELYATEEIPDLSIYGIGSANNGGGTDGEELTFPAVAVPAGSFLYVASETDGFNTFFGFAPDFTSNTASINGDDAIELFKDGVLLDLFGDPDTDGSGEPWEYLDGWAYRQSGASASVTFAVADWQLSGTNVLDGAVDNLSATSPFPLQSFSPDGGGDGGDTNPPSQPFISELHYDNAGADTGEAIEIAGPVGFDLTGWSIVLYNGNGGGDYKTVALTGSLLGSDLGIQFVAISGIQNGSPDGVALVDDAGNTREFLSYEGSFTAVGGPADGMLSTDIGVRESSSTPVGYSLQRCDGIWQAPAPATFGAPNCDGGDPEPEPKIVKIHAVQGSTDVSPLMNQTVTIEGVVTGDFQHGQGNHGDLDGFFVQEENIDQDSDPATSEGIFVFEGNDRVASVDVQPGDLVRVTGVALEFSGLTEIAVDRTGTVEKIGSAELPALTNITIGDSVELEAVESMYVRLPQDLQISEYFNFGRFGDLVLSLPRDGEPRVMTPTAVEAPGSDEYAQRLAENLANRIVLDDGREAQNPDPARHPNGEDFTLQNRFRGGDVVRNVVGVMHYGFNNRFRVQPTEGAEFLQQNYRPDAPDVGGHIKVASFNVLNYFTTLDARGADNEEEFLRQRAKIIAAIAALDADIVGLIEIENNVAAIEDLVAGLNAHSGSQYRYVDTGNVGTDQIRVALIYQDSVQPLGSFAVLDSSVDARFLDGKNRPAIAQTFEDASGAVFTIAVNHFKSKGSACTDVNDPDLGDGQGNCNGTRTAAAMALADWLATDPTGSADPDFLIIGDLNAYDKEDPIMALIGAGYRDLVADYEGEFAYSYVFDGQFGYLDHALANSDLARQVTNTRVWHINADEPSLLDYDTSFKQPAQDALYEANAFRSSDHDPVVVGLDLIATPRDKDDCKKGGWQTRQRLDGSGFRNQGQCIQYFLTGK